MLLYRPAKHLQGVTCVLLFVHREHRGFPIGNLDSNLYQRGWQPKIMVVQDFDVRFYSRHSHCTFSLLYLLYSPYSWHLDVNPNYAASQIHSAQTTIQTKTSWRKEVLLILLIPDSRETRTPRFLVVIAIVLEYNNWQQQWTSIGTLQLWLSILWIISVDNGNDKCKDLSILDIRRTLPIISEEINDSWQWGATKVPPTISYYEPWSKSLGNILQTPRTQSWSAETLSG